MGHEYVAGLGYMQLPGCLEDGVGVKIQGWT